MLPPLLQKITAKKIFKGDAPTAKVKKGASAIPKKTVDGASAAKATPKRAPVAASPLKTPTEEKVDVSTTPATTLSDSERTPVVATQNVDSETQRTAQPVLKSVIKKGGAPPMKSINTPSQSSPTIAKKGSSPPRKAVVSKTAVPSQPKFSSSVAELVRKAESASRADAPPPKQQTRQKATSFSTQLKSVFTKTVPKPAPVPPIPSKAPIKPPVASVERPPEDESPQTEEPLKHTPVDSVPSQEEEEKEGEGGMPEATSTIEVQSQVAEMTSNAASGPEQQPEAAVEVDTPATHEETSEKTELEEPLVAHETPCPKSDPSPDDTAQADVTESGDLTSATTPNESRERPVESILVPPPSKLADPQSQPAEDIQEDLKESDTTNEPKLAKISDTSKPPGEDLPVEAENLSPDPDDKEIGQTLSDAAQGTSAKSESAEQGSAQATLSPDSNELTGVERTISETAENQEHGFYTHGENENKISIEAQASTTTADVKSSRVEGSISDILPDSRSPPSEPVNAVSAQDDADTASQHETEVIEPPEAQVKADLPEQDSGAQPADSQSKPSDSLIISKAAERASYAKRASSLVDSEESADSGEPTERAFAEYTPLPPTSEHLTPSAAPVETPPVGGKVSEAEDSTHQECEEVDKQLPDKKEMEAAPPELPAESHPEEQETEKVQAEQCEVNETPIVIEEPAVDADIGSAIVKAPEPVTEVVSEVEIDAKVLVSVPEESIPPVTAIAPKDEMTGAAAQQPIDEGVESRVEGGSEAILKPSSDDVPAQGDHGQDNLIAESQLQSESVDVCVTKTAEAALVANQKSASETITNLHKFEQISSKVSLGGTSHGNSHFRISDLTGSHLTTYSSNTGAQDPTSRADDLITSVCFDQDFRRTSDMKSQEKASYEIDSALIRDRAGRDSGQTHESDLTPAPQSTVDDSPICEKETLVAESRSSSMSHTKADLQNQPQEVWADVSVNPIYDESQKPLDKEADVIIQPPEPSYHFPDTSSLRQSQLPDTDFDEFAHLQLPKRKAVSASMASLRAQTTTSQDGLTWLNDTNDHAVAVVINVARRSLMAMATPMTRLQPAHLGTVSPEETPSPLGESISPASPQPSKVEIQGGEFIRPSDTMQISPPPSSSAQTVHVTSIVQPSISEVSPRMPIQSSSVQTTTAQYKQPFVNATRPPQASTVGLATEVLPDQILDAPRPISLYHDVNVPSIAAPTRPMTTSTKLGSSEASPKNSGTLAQPITIPKSITSNTEPAVVKPLESIQVSETKNIAAQSISRPLKLTNAVNLEDVMQISSMRPPTTRVVYTQPAPTAHQEAQIRPSQVQIPDQQYSGPVQSQAILSPPQSDSKGGLRSSGNMPSEVDKGAVIQKPRSGSVSTCGMSTYRKLNAAEIFRSTQPFKRELTISPLYLYWKRTQQALLRAA